MDGAWPSIKVFDHDFLLHLQALNYLAQVPSNRPLIKCEEGLLDILQKILNK